MKYEAIIYRTDGTKLTLKAEDKLQACKIAMNYHNTFGYDVAVTETRVILYRMSEQNPQCKPEGENETKN